MLQLLHNNPIIGYVLSATLLALYIYILQKGKNWIWQETLLAFAYAVALPFGSRILSFWLGGFQGDLLSRNMLSLTMLAMVCQGLAVYFTRNSDDPVVRTSLAIANILSRGGLLLCAAYALYNVEGFNLLALKGDCIFMGVLILGDLAQIKKLTRKDGCISFDRQEKTCAAIDAIGSFLLGPFLLCFPSASAHFFMRYVAVTGVHEMLLRSFGFQMFASSLLSLACLCFKRPGDAAYVLRAKFVVYIPLLSASFWYIITSEPGPTNWGCILASFSSLVLAVNCFAGQVDMLARRRARVQFEYSSKSE